MSKKILVAGESWTSFTTHVKGFDTFYTSRYEEGIEFIGRAIANAGYELVYLPSQYVAERFPWTPEEMSQYACIVLSDIGSNSLLLPDRVFNDGKATPNRCAGLRDYVNQGGALLMVGGYLSFTGIDCKARYGQTEVADVLPVTCLDIDDRAEHPEGVVPSVEARGALEGMPTQWPALLGYNRTLPRQGFDVLATVCGDPLVAVGEFGKGRSAAFTSDCAPHWAPADFTSWEGYDLLWKKVFDYLTRA